MIVYNPDNELSDNEVEEDEDMEVDEITSDIDIDDIDSDEDDFTSDSDEDELLNDDFYPMRFQFGGGRLTLDVYTS